MMMLQTCQTYAEKQAGPGLSDEEWVMYSQLLRTVKVYMKIQERKMRKPEEPDSGVKIPA